VSFFGGLFKGVAKIASAIGGAAIKQTPVGKIVGLAKGISENLKGSKRARLDPSTVPVTNQTQALAAKLGAPTPRTMITAYQQKPRKYLIRRAPKAGQRLPTLKATARAPSTRKPPRGGLDLAKIAVLWRSQGKPGRWIDFIKANPIRKA